MRLKLTWKIWLLIVCLILSVLAISPRLSTEGLVVKSVQYNSSIYHQGLTQGEIVKSINGYAINSMQDYSSAISKIFIDNQSAKITITTDKNSYVYLADSPPEITLSKIPRTNIKMGLDLEGGARALVSPEIKLNEKEMRDLIAVTNQRLNVYGISDIQIKPVTDLEGNIFMLIQVAGATPSDLEELISKQGKFDAKIGNDTVFVGGNKDITFVCRDDATCAGIEQCQTSSDGEYCRFSFVIYLSEDAAKRQANLTQALNVNQSSQSGGYLEKPLDLYLDGSLVSSLMISSDLKGQVATKIQISGSGTGSTRESAIKNTESEMNKLQTVLITGSLPYKLEIVKLDTLSPLLGQQFINSILLIAVIALLAVALVVFGRYRRIVSSSLVVLTCVSEVIIILGVAAAINWNLDLPSIAGIIATIGTGVDAQIIILDESRSKEFIGIKEKLKRAFFIVFAAYATAFVSLLPLMWAGAGLLKGFAITTLIGITVGVLITRPAFSDLIRLTEKE